MKRSRWKYVFIILIIILFCQSCDIPRYNYDVSQISNIYFVFVDHDGVITEVETLNSDLFAPFLDDYMQIREFEYWNDPIDSVYGYAIYITFQNGDYHLVDEYCTLHCEGGQVRDTWQYYDPEDFSNLWGKYCSIEYILL